MAELSFKSVGEAPSVSQNAENREAPNPIGLVSPMRISKTQKDIFEITKKMHLKVIIIKKLTEINRLLMSNRNKYILVTGSLYLVGKIRKKYL